MTVGIFDDVWEPADWYKTDSEDQGFIANGTNGNHPPGRHAASLIDWSTFWDDLHDQDDG